MEQNINEKKIDQNISRTTNPSKRIYNYDLHVHVKKTAEIIKAIDQLWTVFVELHMSLINFEYSRLTILIIGL